MQLSNRDCQCSRLFCSQTESFCAIIWNCKTRNAAHMKSVRAAAMRQTKRSFSPVPLSDYGWLGIPLCQCKDM